MGYNKYNIFIKLFMSSLSFVTLSVPTMAEFKPYGKFLPGPGNPMLQVRTR